MERRSYEFFLVRYVSDTVRNEFLNIGVILRPIDEGSGAGVVRFTRNWKRVLCLDPDADLEMLEALEQEFKRIVEEEGHVKKLEDLAGSLSLGIQLFGPTGVFGERDLDIELERLMLLYVEPRRPAIGSSQVNQS